MPLQAKFKRDNHSETAQAAALVVVSSWRCCVCYHIYLPQMCPHVISCEPSQQPSALHILRCHAHVRTIIDSDKIRWGLMWRSLCCLPVVNQLHSPSAPPPQVPLINQAVANDGDPDGVVARIQERQGR